MASGEGFVVVVVLVLGVAQNPVVLSHLRNLRENVTLLFYLPCQVEWGKNSEGNNTGPEARS